MDKEQLILTKISRDIEELKHMIQKQDSISLELKFNLIDLFTDSLKEISRIEAIEE